MDSIVMARKVQIRQRVRRWSGVFVLLGFSLSAQAAFTPVLTEFMASNSGTLLDEDGTSSDWIEVANFELSSSREYLALVESNGGSNEK